MVVAIRFLVATLTVSNVPAYPLEGLRVPREPMPLPVGGQTSPPWLTQSPGLGTRSVPLPAEIVSRRIIAGRGTELAESQGPPLPGEVIYRNANGPVVYPLSPSERIADDLTTICATSYLTSIEVRVYGFGDGSGPGFDITIELFDGCPGDGGTPIDGFLVSVALPDDGLFDVVIDFAKSPILLGHSVWLAMSTSSSHAGWVFGGQPDVGESLDRFDSFFFPCNTTLGGCPPQGLACANGAATLRGVDCIPAFTAYRADAPSGFHLPLQLHELMADDILPSTAPGLCDLVSYAPSVAGLAGSYCMTYEIWSDDPVAIAPVAPVMGTQRTCCSDSPECDLTFSPPVTIPTPRFWFAYDVSGNPAGPVLASAYPSLGFSGDCFAIYGNPDPNVWSECVWYFGGCPPIGNNPCGTFYNVIRCAGTEPSGACCVPDSPDGKRCHDDVPVSKCTGSLAIQASCEDEPFDPPCPPSTYCPPGAVTFVNPPFGVVDARRPVAPSAQQMYVVEAPSGVNPICWSACNSEGSTLSIGEYEEVSPGVFSITLSTPLVAGTVTELTYTDADGQRTTGRFTAHPGNVNGDTYAGPTDILALIDCLNGVNQAVNCPWGLYSSDIDRTGVVTPADILALINVLNGVSCGGGACPWGPTLPMGSCMP